MARSVLLIEHRAAAAEALKAPLVEAGFEVRVVPGAEAAMVAAMQRSPDVVILDVELARQGDGVAAARALRRTRGSQVLFHTERADPDTLARIDRMFEGSAALMLRPASGAAVVEAVRRVLASAAHPHRLGPSVLQALWEFELRHIATGRSVSALSRDGATVEPGGGFDERFPWEAHEASVREACFGWSREKFEVLVTMVSRADR